MFPGYAAANHPQQTKKRGAVDSVDDRQIMAETFNPINARFGGFTIDVAASADNAKCERFYTREDDGLTQSWAGERVWCNPPFSGIEAWVRKAWREHGTAETIVMLLPANRTEQGWWHDLVEPFRDRPGSPLKVEFIRGRPRFARPGKQHAGKNNRPPFGCCLLVWQRISVEAPADLFEHP